SSEVKARIGLQIEQFFADSAKHDTYFDRLGLQFIEALLTFVPEGTTTSMQDSMDAVFSAIVLDSWTAFETLAGDLWTAAVDNEEGEVAARLVAAASARNLKRPDDNVRPETIYKAGLNYINDGDLILLDGSLVNRLNIVAVNLGLALIEHIDGILTPARTP